MQLKYIRLAGFKSFVEPTTISLPSKLIGVVGPNGCGKSNVIDAIRWVMGESSAKTLRGDQMADVIFNGSTARKPVGKASVELVFDNSLGKAPGPYAGYNEISIRRELSRDGQSGYFVNKTRSRRRDITDLFLGTGLGSRSYSIIEQGMVGRIIEAKPEELRSLIEEAAGVSKYKERRRETENRIRHTRENLSRVEDIRKELDAQLNRLQRQSAAAERYKKLRDREKHLKAQLMGLRWKSLVEALGEKDTELARTQKKADGKLADQRAAESNIEKLRSQQTEANESLNQTQGEYYSAGADVSAVEQNIKHLLETRERQKQELQRLNQTQFEVNEHLRADQSRAQEVEAVLKLSEPRLSEAESDFKQAMEHYQAAESALAEWQSEWETFGAESAMSEQEAKVQGIKIEGLEKQLEDSGERRQRLHAQLGEIDRQLQAIHIEEMKQACADAEQECGRLRESVEQLEQNLHDCRSAVEEQGDTSQDLRDRLRTAEARLEYLLEQRTAEELKGADADQWLQSQRAGDSVALTARLQVEPGWEKALDRVLGRRGATVCVGSPFTIDFENAPGMILGERGARPTTPEQVDGFPRLMEKVNSPDLDLRPWLNQVYVADSVSQALQYRTSLEMGESVITRDGVWIGYNWLDLGDSEHAVVSRAVEIEELQSQVESTSKELEQSMQTGEELAQQLAAVEQRLSEHRDELGRMDRESYRLSSDLGQTETRHGELKSQRFQTETELKGLEEQTGIIRDQVIAANRLLERAERQGTEFATKRETLIENKDQLRDRYEQARSELENARDRKHEVEFSRQREQTECNNLKENLARLTKQQKGMEQRKSELEALVDDDQEPEKELRAKLESLLSARVRLEQQLSQARARVQQYDDAIRLQEQRRQEFELEVQAMRDQLEAQKIQRQEVLVKRDTLNDQIKELGKHPRELVDQLPDDAQAPTWESDLEDVIRKIERIGPVNLVAIEEFEEQSERKEYLDKQSEDLNEALETLESVIQKIDRETRARFKDTFESLNNRFQEFFPRLFGGGSAYLELTGTDLLDAGVAVMARPPGKRNSTIHLLSGGEKALTAVSLLFSFFDLNPAPFCVLDEVDAPLDDANVQRYSDTLKTLSNRTQLIFITHNKITMESADTLIGVTMGEPGVSRLVSVDVEEAVEMAAQ